MPIIATDTQRWSNVVKHEYEPSLGYCRAVLEKDSGATAFPLGTVVGKITASGKVVKAVETATDGSNVAVGVVLADQTEKGQPTKVLALVRGASIVSKAGLILDATFDTDVKKKAVYDALEGLGILANEAV